MKFLLQEPIQPKYLYINPKTNIVHLLLPIMSGSEIGSDNTCKAVYSLQEFFGFAGANEQKTALSELVRYQAVLEGDIKYCKYLDADARIRKDKEARLLQIKMYLDILKSIQNDKQLLEPLHLAFPLYPVPVEMLMRRKDSNLHSVILRPQEEDLQLRTTAIKPIFSANHSRWVNDSSQYEESLLYEQLVIAYQGLNLQPKTKEHIVKRVLSNLEHCEVDFEHVKATLSSEVEACLGKDYKSSFDKTQELAEVTQVYIDSELGYTPESHEEYINALIGYCAPNLFDFSADSPFYSINSQPLLIVVTQFFLAELNLLAYAEGWSNSNFGQIMEEQPDLVKELAQTVTKALSDQASVEEALIVTVNKYHQLFQLASLIPEEHIASLKQRFTSHYNSIKDSPHFDEFMFLSDKLGLFVTRFSFICTHFAEFMQTGCFKLASNEQEFLQQAQADFATIDKPQNQLPHYNEQIKAELELDLSKMNNYKLQALYEDINTYPEPTFKQTLLIQFKQECPDFKPQINAKAFLQLVAYGQQDKALALLKANPELAQDLLKAHNIAFTDYSGRTFTCTTYEYAYWALDSHMQRMLEKWMNEETKAFILNRLLDIEHLEKPSGLLGFLFSRPAAFKRNKGLDYTTKDENGEIVHHNDAHFSLKPLIDALAHYIQAYDQSSKSTEADWAALNTIWVEEVGRAQRQVPAHIAQEYCHPNRSFWSVIKNKSTLDASNPCNLMRQINFYNSDSKSDDLWFTPDSAEANFGLGFSFAIARGSLPIAVNGEQQEQQKELFLRLLQDDLAALKTIYEIRTEDLKQSLHNLNQQASAQQSHEYKIWPTTIQ